MASAEPESSATMAVTSREPITITAHDSLEGSPPVSTVSTSLAGMQTEPMNRQSTKSARVRNSSPQSEIRSRREESAGRPVMVLYHFSIR